MIDRNDPEAMKKMEPALRKMSILAHNVFTKPDGKELMDLLKGYLYMDVGTKDNILVTVGKQDYLRWLIQICDIGKQLIGEE